MQNEDKREERYLMPIECEKCDFVCTYRRKTGNKSYGYFEEGCHQIGISKKYLDGSLATYCKNHGKKS